MSSSDEELLPRFTYEEDEDEDDTTSLVSPALALAGRNQHAAFVVVCGSQSLGRIIPLGKRQTLGRAMSSDIQLFEKGVSRRHAELVSLPAGRVLIKDLDSSNGIRINGELVEQHVLGEGDRVQVGDIHMVLVSMVEPSETRRVPPPIDPVTKLPTRRSFIQTLINDLQYAQSCTESVAVCILSVDQARSLVDIFGTDAGNNALGQVVRIVRPLLQDSETLIARFGAHEIAVILNDTGLSEACMFAESIRRAVALSRLELDDKHFRFTVSIGVAVYPRPDVKDALGLVSAAENNLFKAFLNGRDCVSPAVESAGS